MKTKWISLVLAVLMTNLIFSISHGADKFYYGTYNRWWIGNYLEHYPLMSDSLRFNIVEDVDSTFGHIQALADNSLRTIVEGSGVNSPTHWASLSHYTLWEAEGYPESYLGFTYTGGRLVLDDSASGNMARLFEPFPDLPGLVQTGPIYAQEQKREGEFIPYTAEFRIKSPLTYEPRSGGPSPPICSLKVVGNGQLLAHKMVYKSDFWNFYGYKTFELQYLATQNPIEFQIYWYGNRRLYIDYVKVYDDNGRRLIDLREYDQAIMDYVSQSWVKTTLPDGDTVVYRWYLRDEPRFIDAFEPGRYIDSLLRTVSTERVGNQAFNHYWDDTLEHEYLQRHNPQEYHVDIFPTRSCWGLESSGVAFQQGVSQLTKLLNTSRNEAENWNKDFWVTIQTFYWGYEIPPSGSCCPGCSLQYGGRWYCGPTTRLPTPNEVRLQTFLALTYGADAILNFCYFSGIDSSDANQWLLFLGLYEHIAHSTTARWREIRDFTGPRVEKLGSVFNQLTWQGACFHDSVGSFVLRNGEHSYIDSIIGTDPDSTYVQVGFFEHYGNYFMLVNRRCLESEDEVLNVYFNMPDGPYYVTDMFTPEFPDGKICGVGPYIVALEPGEGRLFKLERIIEKPGFLMWVINNGSDPPWIYPNIQEAIDAANDWSTIIAQPDTYYENIDFKGKNCTVASLLHWYPGNTQYISQTIIDGSSPTHPDSGSVVRFVSGEGPCAALKGFTIRNGTGTALYHPGKDLLVKYGGGICIKNSSPTIVNNIITTNSADDGGGIACMDNSDPQILNNLIEENEADQDGGGIAGYSNSDVAPIIVNNIIANNLAGRYGGGIYYFASPFIINNTIDSNSALHSGGGIYLPLGSHGHIENNIITNSLNGNGISGWGSEVFSYNDVWNNQSIDFDINYPEGVGDTSWGENHNGTDCDQYYNISQDPYFYDGYHLIDGSACVDAGDNEAPYLLPTDFEGNERVVDGDENGSYFVDMGAYEYQSGFRGGGGAKIAAGDTTSESKSGAGAPNAFELSQNYPNPFNPVTSIQFTVGSDQTSSHINLKIYNLCGQLVKTLVDEEKISGSYTVTWDGKNNSGKEVASGIYFCQLNSKNFKETKRMVLIK